MKINVESFMNLKKNLIVIFSIGVIIGVAGFYLYQGQSQHNLTAKEAGEKAMTFINQAIQGQNITASLVSVAEESGVYKIHLKIAEQEYDSYVTKDGKFLFSSAFDLSGGNGQTSSEKSSTTAQKQDRPDVKLFVMSYCPYGLQAQKMFLPVYNLLKDKADMGVYFVNYIMHEKKEIDENLRQYCIQKEQKDKYFNYLSCFVKAGDFNGCLSEAKIDKTAMNSCVAKTDEQYKITSQYNDKSTWLNGNYPRFDVSADLNKEYGVQGSPTLVINGKAVELTSRSPEEFKTAVCNAFNSPPQECSQTLSDQAFSPGFGLEGGSSGGGSCQ